MIDVDLRSQLMGAVTTNQNYLKDSISNSNESSFDNIFDKAQFKQQKCGEQTNEKSDYKHYEYNKEIINPKENRYDKEIDNNKTSDKKPVKESDNNKKEKEVINTDKEVVNTDKEVTNKNNQVKNNDNQVRDDNKDECKNETNINQKLENDILMLLSQMAGINEEEIVNWLMESGYEVSELLDTKMFGEIISKMYLELKNQDVLLLDNAVGDINEIYREIKNLESQIISNSEPVLDIIGNSNSESIEAAISLGNIGNIDSEAVTQDGNAVATIQSMETNKYLSVKNTGAPEDVKQVNSISGQLVEGSSTDLQSVMPVSQFRTAGKLNLWSNEVLSTTKSNMMSMNSEIDIIKQIDLKQIGISKQLHIELNPRELGEMSIRLIEENSNIIAQISVDNEKTKDLLLSQIDILKKSLEENGINIEDVTVDIKQNSHESQMQQEKQKSSKRIEELINKHMSGDDVDDEIVEQIKISEVDYTA